MSLYGSLLSLELAFHPSRPDSFNPFIFKRFGTLFTLRSTRISRNSSGINRLRTLCKKIGEWVGSGAFLPLDVRTFRRSDACPPGRVRTIPFFSSTYKSLFPQLLCFVIYTKRPGAYPRKMKSRMKPQVFCRSSRLEFQRSDAEIASRMGLRDVRTIRFSWRASCALAPGGVGHDW